MEFHCDVCNKDFEKKQSLEMHNHAKHMSKEESQKVREGQREKKQTASKIKKFLLYGIPIVIVIWFAFVILFGEKPFSDGQVHWHADLSIELCGENILLPKPTGGSVHGQPFIGTPIMHLHSEPKIHLEGVIQKKEDITLENFMGIVGLNFKNNELLNYKNGDNCPDNSTGTVKLLVNGIENPAIADKSIVDGESYELVFN